MNGSRLCAKTHMRGLGRSDREARRERDSNPRYTRAYNGLAIRRFRPLSHLSELINGTPACFERLSEESPCSLNRLALQACPAVKVRQGVLGLCQATRTARQQVITSTML